MSEPSAAPVSQLPKWHEFMAPLLKVLSDRQVWRKRDMEEAILNGIGWAISMLRRAGAIRSTP